jgi:hypothetical protein
MRLHHAHVLQNSIYVRNILVQPGPLTLPPKERSLETPRFRIIDFGRGKETGRMSEDEAKYEATREMREAKRELNCYFLTS